MTIKVVFKFDSKVLMELTNPELIPAIDDYITIDSRDYSIYSIKKRFVYDTSSENECQVIIISLIKHNLSL